MFSMALLTIQAVFLLPIYAKLCVQNIYFIIIKFLKAIIISTYVNNYCAFVAILFSHQ